MASKKLAGSLKQTYIGLEVIFNRICSFGNAARPEATQLRKMGGRHEPFGRRDTNISVIHMLLISISITIQLITMTMTMTMTSTSSCYYNRRDVRPASFSAGTCTLNLPTSLNFSTWQPILPTVRPMATPSA